ncbi:hypothetical protein HF086_000001 [Spodoptera exigua]|uniref:Transmembrane protein 267 n=1 Tax=Spodoptera exigua TaxID=7107 RepID=A0A922MMZ8_SPOEX|nr:hypothetical protein HF086_000001 [Spodoptera exigua]
MLRVLRLSATAVLLLTAYFGDVIVFRSKYSNSLLFRAICDVLVHGGLGFLSSIIFFSIDNNYFSLDYDGTIHIILCTFFSSVIDIDHVFVAKSIYLKDMVNLKHRGIFHCTTFWLALTALLLLYSYIKKKIEVYMLSFMIFIAYITHHLRDGTRRGIWLYPLGSTPPVDKRLYYFILGTFPHICAMLFKRYKRYINYPNLETAFTV